jgi:hypothetical protein
MPGKMITGKGRIEPLLNHRRKIMNAEAGATQRSV